MRVIIHWHVQKQGTAITQRRRTKEIIQNGSKCVNTPHVLNV